MKISWPEFPRHFIPRSVPTKRCWWCGNPADSREHKIKLTDIIREKAHGSDSDALLIDKALITQDTRGPNSSKKKFSARFCKRCNNQRSQPFDHAQTVFATYFRAHESTIVSTKTLHLSEVFPTDEGSHAENLRRYFVKHASSLLAEHGVDISYNIKSYLDGLNPLSDMHFCLGVCTGVYQILSRLPEDISGPIGYDDLKVFRFSKSGELAEICGCWVYRSLHIIWSYRWNRSVPVANPFCGAIALLEDDNPRLPVHLNESPPG